MPDWVEIANFASIQDKNDTRVFFVNNDKYNTINEICRNWLSFVTKRSWVRVPLAAQNVKGCLSCY